jgi:membrane dipeptidase
MSPDAALAAAERLHRDASVFDMVSPLLPVVFPRAVDDYIAGGVTAVGATVLDAGFHSLTEGAAEGLRGIAHLYTLLRRLPGRLLLVREVADFERAKVSGRLGIVPHFQNCTYFERDVRLVEVFYQLGVRVAQLSYNVANLVGAGCMEPTDGGLTTFGKRLIAEMNRVGMLVDGAHTGERTSLDAIATCRAPFIFSHAGCRAVYDHPRNITDEQIRACAATGGVIGILGLPYFLSDSRQPAIEHLVRHAVHVAELVGAEHVGIGMDYFHGIIPYSTAEEQATQDAADLESDLWNPGTLPPGPWSCAPGIETPAGMRNLTAALLQHGFSEPEVRGIIGGNFLRVFGEVWKPED